MKQRTIKDPTFNIYNKGGSVEKALEGRGDLSEKEELQLLADAEKEREDAIRIKKEHIKNVYEKTKKKIHWKPESVGGGQKVVMEMMDPTIKTLQKATKEYRRALAAEGMDTS